MILMVLMALVPTHGLLTSRLPLTRRTAPFSSRISTAERSPSCNLVASELDVEGVVRVDRVITSAVASELLAWVNVSLEEALEATRGHSEFEEPWRRHFGDVKSPARRHDLKLGLEAPPVAAALRTLLPALRPAIVSSLGEDAELYELAALVALPGAARQPVHPDTPILSRKGTDKGAVILTAFVALQPVEAAMGPTIFLPQTHTEAAHASFFSLDNFEAFTAWDDEDEDYGDNAGRAAHLALGEAQLAAWPLTWRAELGTGDASLFDSRCLHAGEANTSPKPRVLFYCSFIRAAHATSCEGTLRADLRGKRTKLRDLCNKGISA